MKKLPTVKLLNDPHYRQGEFDGLCSYYTGAMLLATLYPKYESSFNEPMSERTSKFFSDDPLLSNYKKGEDVRLILARWFSQGEYIRRVTTILNNLMRKDKQQTRFRCQDETAHDNTFYDVIVGSIDDGLR